MSTKSDQKKIIDSSISRKKVNQIDRSGHEISFYLICDEGSSNPRNITKVKLGFKKLGFFVVLIISFRFSDFDIFVFYSL
jgi:hypothetical protein